MRGLIQTVLIGVALLAGSPLHAAVTLSDLQIMGRALGFLSKPPSGDVRAGIVIAAGNAQSEQEGAELQRLMGQGMKIGNVTLKPVLVHLADVAAAEVELFILTGGIDAAATPVAGAAARKGIACMTADLAQVRSGRCVMGVSSQPKIQILVNRTAAAQARLSFSSVFRMMITEI
jgi:hypothetical protein